MEGTSPYQPLAAGMTKANGLQGGPQVFVFWADKVTGNKPAQEGSVTGYGSLSQVGRSVGNASWTGRDLLSISLGSSNTFPSLSESRRRRWWMGDL